MAPLTRTILLLAGLSLPAWADSAPDTDMVALRAAYTRAPANWPQAQTSDNVTPTALAPIPKGNVNEAKAALGSMLFHDPILSRDNSISCASCHQAERHFADDASVSTGVEQRQGARNAPPIFGVDLWQSFFWDGRAKTAEQQALMPIEEHKEMDLTISEALSRLNQSSEYYDLFHQVYGEDIQRDGIQPQHLSNAIVEFERTLNAPATLYTQFITTAYQSPEKAVAMLNDQQLQGLHLYRTKAKCMTCHEGPLLSDNEFHSTGLHYYQRRFQDLGRYDFTGEAEDVGKFRTPSLLGVKDTFPWMHNGLFNQMLGIVRMYNAGGARPKRKAEQLDDPMFPETTDLLIPLHLTKQEEQDLEAFLNIL